MTFDDDDDDDAGDSGGTIMLVTHCALLCLCLFIVPKSIISTCSFPSISDGRALAFIVSSR